MKTLVEIIKTAVVLVLCAVFLIMAFGCAHVTTFAQGFTQRDDRWCDKHVEASQWECWNHAAR